MKKYYKDNQQIKRPKVVIYDGKVYNNPSDEQLQDFGYIIKEDSKKKHFVNKKIQIKRQKAYQASADKYFLAYLAYKELGNQEAAEEMKNRWLLERNFISKEFPYKEY